MRITPNDIHEQRFRTAFRGFDQVEVDTFLNHVAEEMERLQEEVSGLKTDLELERSTKSQLEELLGVARQLQTTIMDKAKEDARIVMNQAELVAERLTSEAHEGVQEIRRDLQLLKERKATLLAELSGLAHSVNQWVERIDKNDAASGETTEPEKGNTAQAPRPLIRLATQNEGEEDPAAYELEAEAFDLDDELLRKELAEHEAEPKVDGIGEEEP